MINYSEKLIHLFINNGSGKITKFINENLSNEDCALARKYLSNIIAEKDVSDKINFKKSIEKKVNNWIANYGIDNVSNLIDKMKPEEIHIANAHLKAVKRFF